MQVGAGTIPWWHDIAFATDTFKSEAHLLRRVVTFQDPTPRPAVSSTDPRGQTEPDPLFRNSIHKGLDPRGYLYVYFVIWQPETLNVVQTGKNVSSIHMKANSKR